MQILDFLRKLILRDLERINFNNLILVICILLISLNIYLKNNKDYSSYIH